MNLCGDGHDEVCYDGAECPACEMKGERDEAQADAHRMEREIANLNDQIQNMEDTL